MKNSFLKKIIPIILFSFFISVPMALAAEGILPDEHGASSTVCTQYKTGAHTKNNCGNYTLNDFLTMGVKVTTWILGVVGSVALLFFIYGGFVWILSGGNSELVKKGRDIITGAVIGLIIVFSSYLIVQFSLQVLGINADSPLITITNWFKIKK